MRWWMTIDPPCIMSVDNASVKGMDFSELIIDEPDLWMVQWIEGKGELERQEVIDGTGDGDLNLNGLRETFIDIIPYCPLFDQFLERIRVKGLTLQQAKKIKVDLINEVFNAKRQAPFHYPVAAGDYWWDASDATLFASTVPAIQNAIAKINEIIARINAQFPALQSIDDQLSARDQSVVAQVNNNAVAPGAGLVNQINVNVVTQGALIVNEINGSIVNYMNANSGTVQGACASTPTQIGETSVAVARPGLSPGQMLMAAAIGTQLLGCVSGFANLSMGALTTQGWSPMSNVVQSNTSWIPIGSTVPVNVTPTEAGAIMQGIAARTNQLQLKRNIKIGEVNALTTIDAVIDYDVTTGWGTGVYMDIS